MIIYPIDFFKNSAISLFSHWLVNVRAHSCICLGPSLLSPLPSSYYCGEFQLWALIGIVFFPFLFFFSSLPLTVPCTSSDMDCGSWLAEGADKDHVRTTQGRKDSEPISPSFASLPRCCIQSPAPTYISSKQPEAAPELFSLPQNYWSVYFSLTSVISLRLKYLLGKKPASDALKVQKPDGPYFSVE